MGAKREETLPSLRSLSGGVDVLVLAGEHSGDEHAARLVRQARVAQPSLRVAAIGGERLQEAGAELLFDLTEHSVVGVAEVLRHYGFFKRLFHAVLDWVAEHQPRAVLFVDYPGLNLRLAAEMRRRGLSRKGGGAVRTLFYISPQVWAWKQGRRFRMAESLDALGCIFPF
ncbi:MAG: lipid-A-disaccharide synthase, partial [Verrucomicrobiota bacterium]